MASAFTSLFGGAASAVGGPVVGGAADIAGKVATAPLELATNPATPPSTRLAALSGGGLEDILKGAGTDLAIGSGIAAGGNLAAGTGLLGSVTPEAVAQFGNNAAQFGGNLTAGAAPQGFAGAGLVSPSAPALSSLPIEGPITGSPIASIANSSAAPSNFFADPALSGIQSIQGNGQFNLGQGFQNAPQAGGGFLQSAGQTAGDLQKIIGGFNSVAGGGEQTQFAPRAQFTPQFQQAGGLQQLLAALQQQGGIIQGPRF